MDLYDNIVVGQTQRNWDHTKPIPDDHIKLIVEAAHLAPFKQSVEALRMFVSTNMDFNNLVYEWGHDKDLELDEAQAVIDGTALQNQRWLNGQLSAPLLIVFAMYKRESMPKSVRDINSYEENIFSSGVVAGITALTATRLGYKTGFCGCVQWQKMLDEFLKGKDATIKNFWRARSITDIICLGIGHHLENHKRGESVKDGEVLAYNPPELKRKTPTILYK